MHRSDLRGASTDGKAVAASWQDRLRALPRHYLWLALALLLMPAAALAIEINPTPRTFAVAVFYVACLAASAWFFRPRRAEETPDAADPNAELKTKLSAIRGELRKADAWMRLFPLGILLAATLKFTTLTNLSIADFLPLLMEMGRSGSRTVLAFVILLVVLLYFAWRSIALNRELRRLERLLAARLSPPSLA